MPDIFTISYNQKAIELTPPDKRGEDNLAWSKALLNQLQLLWSKIFEDYKKGSLGKYSFWNNFTTYTIGEKVIYGQSVYEALTNNINVFPDTQSDWKLYLEHAIGADERVKYSHIKLVFEYALNTRFNTVFRQPPLVSDIFININSRTLPSFIVQIDELECSVIYNNTSTEYVVNDSFYANYINYNINIPLAVWNNLATNNTIRERIVRNFADKYNSIGLIYQIITY